MTSFDPVSLAGFGFVRLLGWSGAGCVSPLGWFGLFGWESGCGCEFGCGCELGCGRFGCPFGLTGIQSSVLFGFGLSLPDPVSRRKKILNANFSNHKEMGVIQV